MVIAVAGLAYLLALKPYLDRRERQSSFLQYDVAAKLKPCETSSSGVNGVDFEVRCRDVLYRKIVPEETDSWDSDPSITQSVFGLTAGSSGLMPCSDIGFTSWSSRGQPYGGTVLCTSDAVIWCDTDQGIVGRAEIGSNSPSQTWRDATTYFEVQADAESFYPQCGGA